MRFTSSSSGGVGWVSHHVRTLARLGAIRLVRTERRRGAIEHFYEAVRSTVHSDADWERLPVETRDALVAERLRRVLADTGAAAQAGGFAAAWTHLSYLPCELDAQGVDELSRLLEDTLCEAMAISDASAVARRGRAAAADGSRDPPLRAHDAGLTPPARSGELGGRRNKFLPQTS